MGFRTLEIASACEIHIREGQLEVTNEDGTALISLEDLTQIMVHGANIRLSTMDLSILSQNKIALMTLDERYLPTAIMLPFEGHARQSKLMHAQIAASSAVYLDLWVQIIRQKIDNQSRALSIIGMEGTEAVAKYVSNIAAENVDVVEAAAAKEYFSHYHEGLNRRSDDPVNSRLNYGYAVVRSAIARSLVAAGFHPTFGIHHDSQLNAFNLADDLIEPYRAIVDVVAHENIGSNVQLTKNERREIAHVLHNACMMDGTKTEYTRLRKFLQKDGYLRIAPEVYMRIVQNRKSSEKHYRRIDEIAPKTGVVRLLRLTEKQYNNIHMVTGGQDYQEKMVGANCHIML